MKQESRHPYPHHSHLFTLRLWREQTDAGAHEWRGQVQRVTSGETHFFSGWAMLMAHLEDMLGTEDLGAEDFGTDDLDAAAGIPADPPTPDEAGSSAPLD